MITNNLLVTTMCIYGLELSGNYKHLLETIKAFAARVVGAAPGSEYLS